MQRPFFLLASACLSALASSAAAPQSADERQRIEELEKICFKARETKILEEQRRKVEECVSAPPPPREAPKSRQECEKFWASYGWTQGTVSGATRPHLFWDLPECERAFEARRKYEGR
jgi:hypothetical protein